MSHAPRSLKADRTRRESIVCGRAAKRYGDPAARPADGIDNDWNGTVDDADAFPPGVALLAPSALMVLAAGLATAGVRRLRRKGGER
jgi:hypothetical protein